MEFGIFSMDDIEAAKEPAALNCCEKEFMQMPCTEEHIKMVQNGSDS